MFFNSPQLNVGDIVTFKSYFLTILNWTDYGHRHSRQGPTPLRKIKALAGKSAKIIAVRQISEGSFIALQNKYEKRNWKYKELCFFDNAKYQIEGYPIWFTLPMFDVEIHQTSTSNCSIF